MTSIPQAYTHRDVGVQIAEGAEGRQQEMPSQVNRLVQARTMPVRYIEIKINESEQLWRGVHFTSG